MEEGAVSGFEIERYIGVLKSGMAGGCLGYHCVGGRQNSPGRGNGKTQYIFFFFF